MVKTRHYSIAIVGGGLTGLTAALALAPVVAAQGGSLALVAPLQRKPDKRTTALLMPSIALLEEMGIWQACADRSARLSTMRMADGTNRLIRAPLVDFKANELDLEAFGYNIPNDVMLDALEERIAETDTIERIDGFLKSAKINKDLVELTVEDGIELSASLISAADGRQSGLRDAAGITTRSWTYPQTAVVLNYSHTLPHGGVSTEFHTETGPFTHVPLPPTLDAPHRSSLVWIVGPETAETLLTTPLDKLSRQIEEKMQSILGTVTVEDAPQAFPLSGLTANIFAKDRIALLGETAHVFPPIGAQGFNLGLRDVAALRDAVEKNTVAEFDPGNDSVLATFNRNRMLDVNVSTSAVDLLNRSLLADFLPVQAVRAMGLAVLGQFGWLRRAFMKRGMGPPA